MAIRQMTKMGENYYPKTITSAVVDEATGDNLDSMLPFKLVVDETLLISVEDFNNLKAAVLANRPIYIIIGGIASIALVTPIANTTRLRATMISPNMASTAICGEFSFSSDGMVQVLSDPGNPTYMVKAGNGLNIEQDGTISCTLDTNPFIIESTLPSEGVEGKIYLIPSTVTGEQNVMVEYIWVNGAWEKLGEFKTDVDLSAYALKTEVPEVVNNLTEGGATKALSAEQGKVLKGEVDGLSSEIGCDYNAIFNIVGYVRANGTFATTANTQRTDYIPVKGYNIAEVKANLSSSGCVIAFYDDNKSFITEGSLLGEGAYKTYQVTIPDNAFYVVFSNYGSYEPTASLKNTNGVLQRLEVIQPKTEQILSDMGLYKEYSITSDNRSGYYWNGTKFVVATATYNGYAIKLIPGARYELAKRINGITSVVTINGDIGSGSLVRDVKDTDFVAQDNENYLYITFAINTFVTTYNVVEELGYLLPIVKFLDNSLEISEVKNQKVLIFGDSIMCTNTINDDESLTLRKLNWPFFAMDRLNANYFNYAQDGAQWIDSETLTTYQKISGQIELAIKQHDTADMIIVAMGTNNWDLQNDTYESAMAITNINELDKTLIHQSIRWALWRLRDFYKEAKIIVLLPMQRANSLVKGAVFESIEKIAPCYGCIILDQFNELGICSCNEVSGAEGVYLSDGLHPNRKGQLLQAEYVVRKIMLK